MAHCDSAFYIGKTHDICEDYVTTFSAENQSHVVLCDGCSSSEMVDVGARLLSLAFTRLLDTCRDEINEGVIQAFARDFYGTNYNQFIHYHPTMFDATMLFLRDANNAMIDTGVIGDGVIVYKLKNGQVNILDYQCGNMPRYLSYSWDAGRQSAYNQAGVKYFYERYTNNGDRSTNILSSFYHQTFISKANLEWVAVFSDGVHSFRDDKNQPIDFITIINMLTDFKTFTGRFAQRRMNGFRKECAKRGWVHDDDISIGCMYVGDGQ